MSLSLQSIRAVDPTREADWDRRLAQHPEATVFHTAGWASVLTETYGFKPWYLVRETPPATRGAGGIAALGTPMDTDTTVSAFPALLPILEVPRLKGGRRGVSLPFTDHCAWLLPPGDCLGQVAERFWKAPEGDQPTASGDLLKAARDLAEQRGWRSLEFRHPPVGSQDGEETPASTAYAWHELPLLQNEDAQRRLCGSAMRRCLRQAEQAGMPITVSAEEPAVQAYYRLHCQTRRRQGAPPQPWRFFANLHRRLIALGQGFVVLVGRSPVAGALFLRFGRRAVYKFGASDGRDLEARPNQSALWTGFRHAASLGCEVIDLGRTSLHNEGLRRFKRAWGSMETRLTYHCFDLPRRCLKSLDDPTHGWQVRWFQRLPLWVSRLIGRWAYRYAA